ncbi:COG4653 Predicted phage phi-C31 gp36 major capsid-like protein [uncultured Caudovirales phage]|uniref:COG4653 Predicted phage phi-C31 gp36 major capsid-like protein n=1 Tax=uncultured Caudovirales phage TaxID=2100421 RepID=A0A6J5N339_9CAUD|nr:COG4653 Predicted phage phi-C31 gp36 major capsid-like protein [uncultured Caudovirales phage]
MGRIAELSKKKQDGTITEAEAKELAEMIAEANADAEASKGAGADIESDEDKAVDEMADRLVESATKKFEDKMGAVMDAMATKAGDSVVVSGEAKFIIDPKHGKKTFEEAEAIKIAVPGRELKTYGKEVSLKTVHLVKALITGDREKIQLLTEGTGSQGGYLVPEEFANMIVEDARDIQIMRQVGAPSMTISGDTLNLPGLGNRPKARFTGEASKKNTSTVEFTNLVFTPYSLNVIVGLTKQLSSDASLGVSGSIVQYVVGLMAQALAEREEMAFWAGSGSGEPTGVNSYSLRTFTPTASTDTARAQAIQNAFFGLKQSYRNRAVWVGNSTTIASVDGLKDTTGRPLLGNLADTAGLKLKGRPIYEQNDLPNGTLLFGDAGYYQVVDNAGVEVLVSDEATVGGRSAFEENLTYIRVEKRVDGELTLTESFVKLIQM